MAHLDPSAAARYARGTSPPEEAAKVREHLATCAGCRALVEGSPEEADAETLPERALQERAAPRLPTPAPSQKGPTPLDRGKTVGRYLVLNTLGQGGMGVVYAAYDPELDRKVALKLLRPGKAQSGSDGQARLAREAQAMARVSHPNVCSVFDVGTHGDKVFVAMEFIDGPTLKGWVKQKQRTWREILSVFLQAGRGLSAAHAAGLVHRDFKPENVLVGPDGRAYVTDFGLARLAADEAEQAQPRPPDSDEASRLNSPLTQDGLVIGTPQYMAPEQHLGLPPDARSDQFAFCAALYWALYRKRAFDPQQLTLAAVNADAEAEAEAATQPEKVDRTSGARLARISITGRGVIREPPREAKVPAWVRRAILHGLALRPEDRFRSVDELLSELGRDPWVARRRYGLAALGAFAVAAAAFALQEGRARQSLLCSGAEKKLQGVWDGAVRERLERSFLGTGKDFAREASVQATRLLDGYAGGWAAMHRDACEATRVRGEQTEHVLSLRMMCLDRRLQDLGAVTALLAGADAKVVEKAVDAASALPSLRRCADVEALTSQVSLPETPEAKAEVQRLGAQLSQAKALHDAGRFKDALEIASRNVASAQKLGYAPLLGEVLQLQGWLQDRTGDAKAAEQTLESALRAAEVGRDDANRVVIATRLVYDVGYTQGRTDQGLFWARMARAYLDRLGGSDELEADLQTNVGSVYLLQGRFGDALAPYQKALALVEKAYRPNHPKRALVLITLGVAYTKLNELDKAKSCLEESLSIIEATKGATHPSAAFPHINLADVLKQRGDFQGAYFHVQKALSIWEASLGPDHPSLGDLADNLAALLHDQGRFAESLQQSRRALAIKEKALGPDHPDLVYSLSGIAEDLVSLGRPAEGVPYLERALKLQAGDPHGLAETRLSLARALWAAGRDRDRARGLAVQAAEGFARNGNEAEARTANAWIAKNAPQK